MVFRAEDVIERLQRSGAVLDGALRDVDPSEAIEHPSPDAWSLLEIAVHLLDEEREDFRARIESTLEDPARAWTPIDPEGWVSARAYADRDFVETIDAFGSERAAAIDWLRDRIDADWSRTHAHPRLGRLSAGDLLASWAAHDLLHLSQIARTRAHLLDGTVAPWSTRYAMP